MTYDDYRKALMQLKDLPGRTAADLQKAENAQIQATGLADKAVVTAEATVTEGLRSIEAQLSAARSALEPLGKSNLIPPHIRPSGGVDSATRTDVAKAQQALALAVNQVRQTVQAEVKRMEAENDRLASEAKERDRLARDAADRAAAASARRKTLIKRGATAACVLAVLILILIVAL